MIAGSGVTFELVTPRPASTGGSAISIIQLSADAPALDSFLETLGIKPVPVGQAALRDLCAIDQGIVARWTPTSAQIMPHGGAIIVEQLCAAIATLGAASTYPDREGGVRHDPCAIYPEARDLIEACTLDTIARATSPLAIDVLLHQRDLWRDASAPRHPPADAKRLNHLLTPPTIVLLGAPNIGKSSLTNALARRDVSIVADVPGTTRDHIGVTLNLAGLTVRWIDAPGIHAASADPIERAAIDLALKAARSADLILLCADADTPYIDNPHPTVPSLRIALRADRAAPPGAPDADVATSAHQRTGFDTLARAVRDALVPPAVLASHALWRFHPALPLTPDA